MASEDIKQSPAHEDAIVHFFHRVKGHLERLVDSNGGGEEVFNEALKKLDAILLSKSPIEGIKNAGAEILSFMEKGYAAQQKKLDAEEERLQPSHLSSNEPRP